MVKPTDERKIIKGAIETSTFVMPRINGALIRAGQTSKPRRTRSDELDLAIALAADLLFKLTDTRTKLGWNIREDA